MKKIIALVLALMLAVTCFAACGKKDGDTKKKYTVGICNYVDDASLISRSCSPQSAIPSAQSLSSLLTHPAVR